MGPRKRLLVTAVALAALAVGGAAFLLLRHDWNWARPLVERAAGVAMGRNLDLGGDLTVDLGRVTRVEAYDVRLDNVEWGQADELFTARRLAFDARFWPLWLGRLRLERLELDDALVALERRTDGATNWTLGRGPGGGAAAALSFPAAVRLRAADLTLADPARPRGFHLHVDTIESATDGSDQISTGSGLYQGQPFELRATSPAHIDATEPTVPLTLAATIGTTRARAQGRIARDFDAGDLALDLAARSLDELWKLVGFPLPRSPAFTLEGRLRWSEREFTLAQFTAQVGKSDLAGDLRVRVPASGRTHVDADVRSRALDLDDVEGFYGRTPSEEGAPEERAAEAGAPSIFPDVPFDFAKLRVLDARIRFAAARVQGTTAIDDVKLDATLENGRLTLHPLTLGMSAGDLAANAVFDASRSESTVDADLVIRNVDLGRLLAGMDLDEPASGTFGGRAEIESRGNSLREMAQHLDGELGTVLRRGRLGDPLLELVALHLGDFLVAKLADRKSPEPIDCLVGVFGARDGVLETRTLLLDTRHVRIEGEGTIDLAKERIDVRLTQHSKDFSFGALRTPIRIEGPLATRRARLEAGPLLARGGAAVALGLLHPAAALLALVDPGKDDKPDACAEALAQYRPIASGVAAKTRKAPAPKP